MFVRIGQRPDHGFDEPLDLLSDCHRRIEYFLSVLEQIAIRGRGGELTSGARADLSTAIAYFATAAPKHTADEEESLFPRLRASEDAGARKTLDVIARLERDHACADAHHHVVDVLARRWIAEGALDVEAVTELGDRLAALRSIYEEHIGIEDRELFPAARRLLPPFEVHDIGEEMAARRR